MTTKILPFLLLFIIGCAPQQVRTSIGVGGDLNLLSDNVQGGDGGISRSMSHGSFLVGWEVFSSHPTFIDIATGISTLSHLTNDPGSPGYGPEVSIRVRYQHIEEVEFFFEITSAWMYFAERWDPQSTNDGFVISAGPGIAIKAIENSWVTIGIRVTHESNGSKIFGRPEENPGFNADMLYLGWEYRF